MKSDDDVFYRYSPGPLDFKIDLLLFVMEVIIILATIDNGLCFAFMPENKVLGMLLMISRAISIPFIFGLVSIVLSARYAIRNLKKAGYKPEFTIRKAA